MVLLIELWLPILLSAVLAFVASSLIHMVLPYHRSDYRRVDDEDRLMDDLRRNGLAPGVYTVPHAGSPAEMSSPEYVAKKEKGPIAFVTVMSSRQTDITKTLPIWFVYLVFVSLVAGYVASRALPPGAEYGEVFRFTGTTAFAAYVLGLWQESIWYGRPWSITLKSSFDGLIYALLTGGVFGWLWP